MKSVLLGLVLTAFLPLAAQQAAHDPAAMEKARKRGERGMGGQVISFVQVDRLEYRTNEGAGHVWWEGAAWIGTDFHRFVMKTEGLYIVEQPALTTTPAAQAQSLIGQMGRGGGRISPSDVVVGPRDGGLGAPGASTPPGRRSTFPAEVQALYSRPVSPYFDVQVGVRQDLAVGARRTFGVIGVQGLLPYWFDVDTALFVSNDGDTSGRIEVEYDLRFTQRLILQPRAELNFAFQNVDRLSIKRGLAAADAGARFRYELRRQFAPYVGVAWQRVASEPNRISLVAGLSMWF